MSSSSIPATLHAKKPDVVGLAPATGYFFRVRGVTKVGEGSWSQVLSLLAQ